MTGQAIGLDEDTREYARQKVAMVVVYFMSRKNVIGTILDCEEISGEIVRYTEPGILHRIANAPDAALDLALINSASRALDLLGTAAMIQIFADVGNLGNLSYEQLGPIARRVLDKLDAMAADPGLWIWPSPEIIEEVARAHLSGLTIVDLASVERAVVQCAGTRSLSAALTFKHLEPQPDERTTRIFGAGWQSPAAMSSRAGNDA
jgi:hypothetical protein